MRVIVFGYEGKVGSVVAAGLAASAKYPGVVLAVPLLVAGYGRWRRTAIAFALAALAFVLTSPFVVVHGGGAWDDVSRVNRLAREGWLGFEDDPATPAAFSLRLWETVGPVVLVALVGIAVAVRRRERRDLVLLSFAAGYCLSLLPVEAHFDRYVLPLVPVVCVLAGATRVLAVAALVCCVVPLWWSVADTRALTGRDQRLDAAAWIDRGHRILGSACACRYHDRGVPARRRRVRVFAQRLEHWRLE